MASSVPQRRRALLKGWRVGPKSMWLAVWLSIALGVGGCSALLVTRSWIFHGPPTLPAWAYPQGEGVVKTDDSEGDCGGAGGGLPCRRLLFHSVADFSSQQARLVSEFSQRGWSVHNYPAVNADRAGGLIARSDSEDLCIQYSAYERPATVDGLQRPFVISVSVTTCSDIKY